MVGGLFSVKKTDATEQSDNKLIGMLSILLSSKKAVAEKFPNKLAFLLKKVDYIVKYTYNIVIILPLNFGGAMYDY
jgi:hypothetical protein